jgi:formylglycine-generating enzyme required for sulfatase activity
MSRVRALNVVLVVAGLAAGGLFPVAGQQPAGKKYALLVGINRYDFQAHFPDLYGAVNDAVVLGKLLEKQGFKVKILTDEQATLKNIEAELANIKKLAERDDLILIGLAGHGELIGADSYFCPREARKKEKDTLLSLNGLCKELENIKGVAKLVLVDACRDDGRTPRVDAAGVPAQVGLLFSCSPGQRAFETKDKKHGVFFQHVIRGMEGEAKNAKGEVTWHGLRSYVIDHVPDAVAKESPGAKQIPHDVGNVAGIPPLFTVSAITNSIGMKLAYIAPGKFMMGSPKEEKERSDNEFLHEVELTRGFYMGVYAVTQQEYETVMGKNPSYFSAQGGGKEKVAGMDTRRFPVESVSWEDAKEFCGKLSAKEGKTYRLPSEAEWEYVCRAGTTTPFHFGETISTDQANYHGEYVYGNGKKGVYRGRPMPVGSFAPNAWGLYDMHGNVWQWCEDWYDAKYYENSPKTNPLNETKGQIRVLRGGSWSYVPRLCRSAYRDDYAPDYRSYDGGFRVVFVSP